MDRFGLTNIRLTNGFAFVLAACNAALVTVYLFRLEQTMHSSFASGAEILWDMTIPWIRIRITVALILGAICLFSRKMIGIAASAICFIWVIAEHVRWLFLLRQMRGAGTSQAYYLYRIEWWNLAVLVLTSLLLVLVLTTIFSKENQRI